MPFRKCRRRGCMMNHDALGALGALALLAGIGVGAALGIGAGCAGGLLAGIVLAVYAGALVVAVLTY